VPQQFLYYLGIFPVGAQQRRVGVAERVPADVMSLSMIRQVNPFLLSRIV